LLLLVLLVLLLLLLQEHRTGTPHMTKETLIAAAEASKLADAPIQGNTNTWGAARGPGKWYDGWSNIKTLENRDTPLIQRWSNPLKVRPQLTCKFCEIVRMLKKKKLRLQVGRQTH
jgi:hypothetical protein